MNRSKRKKLSRAFDLISEAVEIIENVKDQEQEDMENLPDPFRNGDRGEEMQSFIEMMDEALGYLLDANSVVEQI